jgi:hypothetical protein
MPVLELSSQEGRFWSHGTRGSAGAHLDREARFRTEKHVTARNSTQQVGEARGHVAAPELTSTRR